jgi:hypothetical protein
LGNAVLSKKIHLNYKTTAMGSNGYYKFLNNITTLNNAALAKPQKLKIPNWFSKMPQYSKEVLRGKDADFHKLTGNKYWEEISKSPSWDSIAKYNNALILNKKKV